jgi:hypothetical protein
MRLGLRLKGKGRRRETDQSGIDDTHRWMDGLRTIEARWLLIAAIIDRV